MREMIAKKGVPVLEGPFLADLKGILNLVYAERCCAKDYVIDVGVCEFPACIREIDFVDKLGEIYPAYQRTPELGEYLAVTDKRREKFRYRVAFPAVTVVVARGSPTKETDTIIPNNVVLSLGGGSCKGFHLNSMYNALAFPNVYNSGLVCTGGLSEGVRTARFNTVVTAALDKLWYSPFNSDVNDLRTLYKGSHGAGTLAMWEQATRRSFEEGLRYGELATILNPETSLCSVSTVIDTLVTQYQYYLKYSGVERR